MANANGAAQQPTVATPDQPVSVAKKQLTAWQEECLYQGMSARQGSGSLTGLLTIPSLAVLFALVLSLAASAGAVTSDAMSVDTPAPSRALALYLASAAQGDPWSAPNEALLEIDAYLPKLAEEGHLRAIRAWDESRTPEYQVIHLDGNASVKQQVIARYLSAEQQAAATPAFSLALTPANYRFRYVGPGSGTLVYVFHITPRKKRSGLINGELWIDGATGVVIHEAGYLVKRPSIFIRHLKIVRDVRLQNGAPWIRTTQIEIDARFVGRAELTVTESPCTCERSRDIPTQESRK
jgi:hypothetical protein